MTERTRGHSRSALFLMELILAILIFSVAAAICVRVFAQAHLLSARSQALTQATLLAQSAAEVFKGGACTPQTMNALFGAQEDGDGYQAWYDSDWQPTAQSGAYTLRVGVRTADGIGTAEIIVSDARGALYELSVKKLDAG